MRAQARQLLFRLQGAIVNADATLAGPPHTAGRTCTTLAAADGALITRASGRRVSVTEGERQGTLLSLAMCPGAGHSAIGMDAFSTQRSSDQCNSSLPQHPVRSAAAPLAAVHSLLWTSSGVHSLQPAIAAVLSQPLATGDVQSTVLHGAAWCTQIHLMAQTNVSNVVHIVIGTTALVPVEQQMLQHSEWLDDGACEPAVNEDQPAAPAMSLVKRTYQPSVIIRKRRHGFLSRLRSKGGQRVLERRRLKGRWKKSA